MASRPSASRPCFFPLPVRRSPSGARAGLVVVGLHVGGARSTHTTPQVRRQIAGTRKAARLSRRATRPREIEQSELTCRPTAARPSNQQIDLLRRRGPNPRSCVRLRRRGGVTTRGARLLGRLVSAEWIVPLRHWRAAALCTTGLFALRDWLMIHGSDPRHRPIRDCPRPPQDEGFLRQTVEMISVSRSEEDRFARPMGFPPPRGLGEGDPVFFPTHPPCECCRFPPGGGIDGASTSDENYLETTNPPTWARIF